MRKKKILKGKKSIPGGMPEPRSPYYKELQNAGMQYDINYIKEDYKEYMKSQKDPSNEGFDPNSTIVPPPDESTDESTDEQKGPNIFKKAGSFLAQDGVQAASSAITNIGNAISGGPTSSLESSINKGWDSVADAAGNFGPYGKMVQGAMKAAGALNSIQGAIFGKTDGMTTVDSIMESPLGLITGMGWINQAFGKTSDTITKNEEAFAQTGSSYGGSSAAVDNALNFSGKKYGAFSSGARQDANALIAEARRQQNLVENIGVEATTRNNLLAGMSSIMSNRRAFNLAGGYDQRNVRVGKSGMLLSVKSILAKRNTLKHKPSTLKQGGIIQEIEVFIPDIIKEINITDLTYLQQGGEILDKSQEVSTNPYLEYAYSRFPILKNIDINLYHDSNFKPKEIGNYGDLEYIESKYDTIPYYNDYPKPEKFKGHPVLVYNDNIIDEDIALDLVSHGLRELDPKWKELLSELENDETWFNNVFQDSFENFSGMTYDEYRSLSKKAKTKLLDIFKKSEEFKSGIDGLIRALLVKDELAEKLRYNYSKRELDALKSSEAWQKIIKYLNSYVDSFKQGGSFNIIPEGALHARLHHMKNDENITKKGIPVVSEDENGNLEQQAEIEREEIIFRLEVTKKLEELMKQYDESNDDIYAIEAGKLLVDEILNNTIDNTNKFL